MSESVSKTVLRLRLLDASDEHVNIGDEGYRYFKNVLENNGYMVDSSSIDESDGDIHYIGRVHGYQALHLGDNFYVDYVLYEGNDYENEFVCILKKLAKKAKKFAKLFNKECKDVRIVSYTYYNGVDEPEIY